jgi:hypothetical protein
VISPFILHQFVLKIKLPQNQTKIKPKQTRLNTKNAEPNHEILFIFVPFEKQHKK